MPFIDLVVPCAGAWRDSGGTVVWHQCLREKHHGEKSQKHEWAFWIVQLYVILVALWCYCCTLLKTNGRAHLVGLLPVFSNSFDTFGSRGLRLSERLWDEDVRRSRMKRDLWLVVVGAQWVGSAYTFLWRVLACRCIDVWQKEMKYGTSTRCNEDAWSCDYALPFVTSWPFMIRTSTKIAVSALLCIWQVLTSAQARCHESIWRVLKAAAMQVHPLIHNCGSLEAEECQFWIFWHILPSARYWSKVGSLSL